MKRFLSVCLVIAMLAMLVVVAVPTASFAVTNMVGTVHGGWLRMRSAASFNASTVASYYTGTVVNILGSTGGWYHVSAPDGKTGYMYGSYLTISTGGGGEGTATVWSSNGYGVRMRSGPGTGYRILAVYSVGTRVNVLEKGANWSKIQVGSRVGYMMNQFLNGGGGGGEVGNASVWSGNGLGVRLRTGPGRGYSVIGVYSVGTTVRVLEKGTTWDRIQIGSRVGYMMNEFLRYYSSNEVKNVTLNNTKPVVGNVLAVKTLTPPDATVNYSWLVGGVQAGTAPTYTVADADIGKMIQLKVTGTGNYTGSAISAATEPVTSDTKVTKVTLNTMNPVVGDTLQVSALEPTAATVSYAWRVGDVQKSNGATYKVDVADVGKNIELIVTGTGSYSGTVSSGKTAAVQAAGNVTGATITNQTDPSASAPNVGDTLKVAPIPTQATVAYAWTVDGNAVGSGATLLVDAAFAGKEISVTIVGTGAYGGTATAKTAPVVNRQAVTAVFVTPTNPEYVEGGSSTVLTASVQPTNATVSYQWMAGDAAISGATNMNYTVQKDDVGKTIKVVVTGTGDYKGTQTSAPTSAVVDKTVATPTPAPSTTPTPTPVPSTTPTPTPNPSATPTPTPAPSATPTPTPTPSATPTPTPVPTPIKYTVTVVGGTLVGGVETTGEFEAGTSVSITTTDATFKNWELVTGNIGTPGPDLTQKDVTFVMPDGPVELKVITNTP